MKRNVKLFATGALLVAVFVIWKVFYVPMATAHANMATIRAELSESPPLSAVMTCWIVRDEHGNDKNIYHLDENLTEELLHIIKQGYIVQPCKCGDTIFVDVLFKNGKTISFKMSNHRAIIREFRVQYNVDEFKALLQRVKEAEPATGVIFPDL
jgi:hypothetical protein